MARHYGREGDLIQLRIRTDGKDAQCKASPGLSARSLGNLDDEPLRAVVAAWGNLGRSGFVASERRSPWVEAHGTNWASQAANFLLQAIDYTVQTV